MSSEDVSISSVALRGRDTITASHLLTPLSGSVLHVDIISIAVVVSAYVNPIEILPLSIGDVAQGFTSWRLLRPVFLRQIPKFGFVGLIWLLFSLLVVADCFRSPQW